MKRTNEIVLNAHQLKIVSAEVFFDSSKPGQPLQSTSISYDASRQRATISFAEDLPVSEKNALIVIKFQGTINNDMAGFSRAKYKSAVPPANSVPMEDDHHLVCGFNTLKFLMRMSCESCSIPNHKRGVIDSYFRCSPLNSRAVMLDELFRALTSLT